MDLRNLIPANLEARAGAALISVVALAVLVLVLRWHWIGVGEDRCQAQHASAQARANELQVKREAKRDATATAIATQTHQAAAKATTKTEESTHARARQIEAAPATGACVAPAGLPDLSGAVDAANAARRAAVQGRPYTRRQFRSMAGARPGDHRPLDEVDVELVERHARDPHAGTPAPSG